MRILLYIDDVEVTNQDIHNRVEKLKVRKEKLIKNLEKVNVRAEKAGTIKLLLDIPDIYVPEINLKKSYKNITLSAKEATCNFLSSPWSERLFLHEGDFRQISSSLPAPDLIVCNPPYFDGQKHNLVSPLARKATARHEASLSCSTILEEASRRLNDDGRLCLISPANREDDIQWDAAGSRMYVERKTYVITRVGKAPSRILWRFSKTACSPEVDNLAIRDADNGFTTDYSLLLSPFYINID